MSDGETNVIEIWAQLEYRDGISPGAAARQLCAHLGIYGGAPTLERLLEDLLADDSLAAFDRSLILKAFDEADPEAAAQARRDSFARLNKR
jgi:hypothetical protein